MTAATSKLPEITTKIVELLTPQESQDRHRVVNAAYMLLGESPVDMSKRKEKTEDEIGDGGGNYEGNRLPVVRAWMKQNDVSEDQLCQVFHFEGEAVEMIAADVPGTTYSQKTPHAYLLAALAKFLADGAGKVDDKTAKALCAKLGCVDPTNHAKILKNNLGNHLTGDKSKGWTLTGPGRGPCISSPLCYQDGAVPTSEQLLVTTIRYPANREIQRLNPNP